MSGDFSGLVFLGFIIAVICYGAWVLYQPNPAMQKYEDMMYSKIFDEPTSTWYEVSINETTTLPIFREQRLEVENPQVAPERWMLTDDGEILEVID